MSEPEKIPSLTELRHQLDAAVKEHQQAEAALKEAEQAVQKFESKHRPEPLRTPPRWAGHGPTRDEVKEHEERMAAYQAQFKMEREKVDQLGRELHKKSDALRRLRDEIYTRKNGPIRLAVDFFDPAENEQERQWLVEGVLVRGEVALIGGPRKNLKTSIALDLALSLATGRPFLGRYPVPEPRRVLFMSGESGRPTLIETAKRIAASKGIDDVAALNILWSDKLPDVQLCEFVEFPDRPYCPKTREWRVSMASEFPRHKLDVIILDPLYVMLAAKQRLNASSIFDVGPVLSALTEACRPATPILVHHSTKSLAPGAVMQLEDLAFAGSQEFARQWLLINRRKLFSPGQETTCHQLLVNYGGSAGHNGTFALDVDEGRIAADFGGRTWQVEVLSPEDAKQRDAAARKEKTESRKAERRHGYLDKLLAVLPADGTPISYTAARDASALNSTSLPAAIEEGVALGQVEVLTEEGRPGRRLRRKPASPPVVLAVAC
jgi:hypothetical protein